MHALSASSRSAGLDDHTGDLVSATSRRPAGHLLLRGGATSAGSSYLTWTAAINARDASQGAPFLSPGARPPCPPLRLRPASTITPLELRPASTIRRASSTGEVSRDTAGEGSRRRQVRLAARSCPLPCAPRPPMSASAVSRWHVEVLDRLSSRRLHAAAAHHRVLGRGRAVLVSRDAAGSRCTCPLLIGCRW